jgi:hypothetical protein
LIANSVLEKKNFLVNSYAQIIFIRKLHDLGWQVFYGSKEFYFLIIRYWCSNCKRYSDQYIRHEKYNDKMQKCVTNLCQYCKKTELTVISRYLQVKTSEGIEIKGRPNERHFSFHPKIRYDTGLEMFYIWIAVFNSNRRDRIAHFYILNTKEVKEFDDINLPTYQITDNQKTTLTIRKDGVVLNKGNVYDYSCFNNRFYENWQALELELKKK